jgi:hypothetical protein
MKKQLTVILLVVIFIPLSVYLCFQYFYPSDPDTVGPWKKITSAKDFTDYYDVSSITKDANSVVSFKAMRTYSSVQTDFDGGGKYQSEVLQESIDCSAKTLKASFITEYSEPYGKGRMVGEPTDMKASLTLTQDKDSVGAIKIKTICELGKSS